MPKGEYTKGKELVVGVDSDKFLKYKMRVMYENRKYCQFKQNFVICARGDCASYNLCIVILIVIHVRIMFSLPMTSRVCWRWTLDSDGTIIF